MTGLLKGRRELGSGRFLDLTRERVVIDDGAMGTSIQAHGLDAAGYGGIEGCNEHLVLHNPGLIEAIHASFFEVGVDVVETDTFGGSRHKLDEYGLGERTYEINRVAAEPARRIANHYATPSQPRFVAGSIGPTGLLPALPRPPLRRDSSRGARPGRGSGAGAAAGRAASIDRVLRGVGGTAECGRSRPDGRDDARGTAARPDRPQTLFRLHWGSKGVKDEAWQRLQDEEFLPGCG